MVGARAVHGCNKDYTGIFALSPQSIRRTLTLRVGDIGPILVSETIKTSNWLEAGAKTKARRFDQTSIALHWLTVLLIVGQLATARVVGHGDDNVRTFLTAHRSTGVLTWILVAARLIWRHSFAYLPPWTRNLRFTRAPMRHPTKRRRVRRAIQWLILRPKPSWPSTCGRNLLGIQFL